MAYLIQRLVFVFSMTLVVADNHHEVASSQSKNRYTVRDSERNYTVNAKDAQNKTCNFLGFDGFELTIRQGVDVVFNASQIQSNTSTCSPNQANVSLELDYTVPIFINWTFTSLKSNNDWILDSFQIGFDSEPLSNLTGSYWGNIGANLASSWQCSGLNYISTENSSDMKVPVNITFQNILMEPFVAHGQVSSVGSTTCVSQIERFQAGMIVGAIIGIVAGCGLLVICVMRSRLNRNQATSNNHNNRGGNSYQRVE